jgi:SAM-dependent methyltransferase
MNPYGDVQKLIDTQSDLRKHPQRPRAIVDGMLRGHFKAAEYLDRPVSPGARILDIGCGIGDCVEAASDWGFDAHGVDVIEYWGRDFHHFWEERPRPTGKHLARLHRVDPSDYRLPFPDAYFDFAFSDEVFEHVFNHETMFKEIARVLKPGAISLHQFPGSNYLMEGHVNVPLPLMCKHKWWLTFWALLGRRSERLAHMNWREAADSSAEMMRYCSYVSPRQLRAFARNVGVEIDFVETEGLLAREFGRVANMLKAMPKPLRPPAASVLSLVSQKYMLVHARR